MSNEEIILLRRKRANIKASCTRCKSYIESMDITPENVVQAKLRLDKLNDNWNQYDTVQSELEILVEAEAADRETFEAAFFALSGKIQLIIMGEGNEIEAASNMVASRSQANGNVRLPKITLATFSGAYNEWMPFHNTFKSLIHTNDTLSNIQRFHYLKSALTGEAADVIEALEISEENYNNAWDLLKKRYDNLLLIIKNHIQAMFEWPSLTKENPVALRQIMSGMTKHLSSLKSLNRPTDSWDDILIYLLSTKLDTVTAKEWQMSVEDGSIPTFKQMTDFLLRRCKALETASKKPLSAAQESNTRGGSSKSTASHVASIKEKCPICSEDHFIFHCKKFLNLSTDQRFNQIEVHKLCINCIRTSNHQAKECKARSCKICSKRHNTLLHREGRSESIATEEQQAKETKEQATTVVTSANANRMFNASTIINRENSSL